MTETIAYKILTPAENEALVQDGQFAGSADDLRDGFIHLSTADQLGETLDKHYAGRTDVVIAAIALTQLGDALRWESSRGGQLFPHLYGVLMLTSVIAAGKLERAMDGSVKLPA